MSQRGEDLLMLLLFLFLLNESTWKKKWRRKYKTTSEVIGKERQLDSDHETLKCRLKCYKRKWITLVTHQFLILIRLFLTLNLSPHLSCRKRVGSWQPAWRTELREQRQKLHSNKKAALKSNIGSIWNDHLQQIIAPQPVFNVQSAQNLNCSTQRLTHLKT